MNGVKLKKFAKDHYGSLKNLAKKLGIDQSQISRYMNGKVVPSSDFLIKLSKLGCNIDWLLDKEPETGLSYRVQDNAFQYNKGIANIGNTNNNNGGTEEMVNVVVNNELSECRKIVQLQEELIRMLKEQIAELKKTSK